MTLQELIDIADEGYGDGIVKLYHQEPNGQHGDGLAAFVANELRETFSEGSTDKEQFVTAIFQIERAIEELKDVALALEVAMNGGANRRDARVNFAEETKKINRLYRYFN